MNNTHLHSLYINQSSRIWRENKNTTIQDGSLMNMTFNELSIKPIHGLYKDHAITVDEFKDRHEGILTNRWVDTSHNPNREKIYSLFDPEVEGDITKENLQEWLCDNRHQVTDCISTSSNKRGCGKNAKPANQKKLSNTLSEVRNQKYGITPPSTTTCSLRSGLQPVDYLALNDGLHEEENLTNPKRRKRTTHRPRSAPSATRVAAQKYTLSPKVKNSSTQNTNTFSGVLTTSAALSIPDLDLTGILNTATADRLPDLVLNHETSNLDMDTVKTTDGRGRAGCCRHTFELGRN